MLSAYGNKDDPNDFQEKVRCHTRNRSEAPLLEGDFTDEEEEEEEKESIEVFVCICHHICLYLSSLFVRLVNICHSVWTKISLKVLHFLMQVRLQMGEERGFEDEVNNNVVIYLFNKFE